MIHRIRKVVFPVAGLGTRFLPATKAVPKEMLPVVDRPLIQYAAEEAVAAGAEELIFITRGGKQDIEDHFDVNRELESELIKSGKEAQRVMVRQVVPEHVHCAYVRQPEALGLGHAILCAKRMIGNEPFGIILPDDLIDGGNMYALEQMAEEFATLGASLIATEEVPHDQTRKYGIVSADPVSARLGKLSHIVEKPAPENAPSNQGVVGRYILTPRIFELLEQTKPGAGGEIQLTDAIDALLREQDVYSYRFEGTRYDCGSKMGYLRANVEYALKHPEIGTEFRAYIAGLAGRP